MLSLKLPKWTLTGAAFVAFAIAPAYVTLSATDAYAMNDNNPCDKYKKNGKKWKKCMGQARPDVGDDAFYNAGYWLTKAGKYKEALAKFRQAKNQDDPKVLNYLGFTTRKLGRVEEALSYYRRALAIDPNYAQARAYMGEAFLQKGEAAKAKVQLREIAKRCGTGCREHAELQREIMKFERKG
jgi:tetratricopeptide (TPR) repeat protein